MNDRTTFRLRLAALGLLVPALIAACGGSAPPPAGVDGDAGTVAEAGSPAAAIAAAWDRLAASPAVRYHTTFLTRGGGIAHTSSAAVTVRRTPVAASRFEFASEAGGRAVHLIHDGRLWIDGGDGRLVDVGAPSKSIADQQAPYAIESLWEGIERQLDDYELAGSDTVEGETLAHYRLSEDRRERTAEGYRVDPDQFSADVWLDQDGNLRRLFRGMVEGANGTPDRYDSTTVDVLDLDCACPVEPPAAS